MGIFEKAGIDTGYVIIGILCVLVALIILYIVLLKKFILVQKNYKRFMEGSDAKDMESVLLKRFDILDELTKNGKQDRISIDSLTDNLKFAYQKFSIVKYDAFKEMGGKLSFSLCMLTDNDDGFVLTSMHSNNEGCYTYIKEIIKGESYVILGEEEKKVLQQAKTRRSCLDD